MVIQCIASKRFKFSPESRDGLKLKGLQGKNKWGVQFYLKDNLGLKFVSDIKSINLSVRFWVVMDQSYLHATGTCILKNICMDIFNKLFIKLSTASCKVKTYATEDGIFLKASLVIIDIANIVKICLLVPFKCYAKYFKFALTLIRYLLVVENWSKHK